MPNKQFTKEMVFKTFNEYWHFAKHLSIKQRQVVWNILPKDNQKILDRSFVDGKWEDVFNRNSVSELIEELRNEFGYDLLNIKCKVAIGKSVYLPKQFWTTVIEQLSQFKPKDTTFILGGIKAIECKQNQSVVLIVPASSETKD
jgi:hypothetical protein